MSWEKTISELSVDLVSSEVGAIWIEIWLGKCVGRQEVNKTGQVIKSLYRKELR